MANVETRKEKEKVKRGTREPTEAERFSEFVRRIIAVPKSEIEKTKRRRKKH